MYKVIFGGGHTLHSTYRKGASVRERLVLCETSERRSEALDLNGRLIESEVSYGK